MDDVRQSFHDKVIRLTIIGRGGPLQELEGAIKTRCNGAVETHCFENWYSPGWYWLTVHDEKATKDQAIRIVMGEWGLEGSEIVVFSEMVTTIFVCFKWLTARLSSRMQQMK